MATPSVEPQHSVETSKRTHPAHVTAPAGNNPAPAAPARTQRALAKSQRRKDILRAASELFGARGYAGVSLEDIGARVGVSGPALYRHFTGKQELIGAVLIEASEDLLAGSEGLDLDALIDFQVNFAQRHSEVIRLQERDLHALQGSDQTLVRSLQRSYIERWIRTLKPTLAAPREELRLRVQATIGLINSIPHSTTSSSRRALPTAKVLASMARAALVAPAE